MMVLANQKTFHSVENIGSYLREYLRTTKKIVVSCCQEQIIIRRSGWYVQFPGHYWYTTHT
ncbi:hypothetical protein KDK_32720 [Dictyobacter kobayashii]|uniref:Uncharacterized protein n=1 Tax=Dictyobacter kobayashii TaxID=2014872 RepID=A0A402AK40_9CHLR|nr:hypothetical protein KDK_32720 [Dictyobacter kobayashii]